MRVGLLLAGGTSSRFIYGDKAVYGDFAERTFACLAELCERVYVSCTPENQASLQERLPEGIFLLDRAPYISQGPLSGLYALPFEQVDVLTLSVDNPELSSESLGQLLNFPNAYAEDNFTLSHLTFDKRELTAYLEQGKRRLKAFLEALGAVAIKLPENELIDHNEK